VKIASRIEAGRITAREEEQELNAEAARGLIACPARHLAGARMPLLREALRGMDPAALRRVGELVTHRRTFAVRQGMLALDVVEVPGEVQYEVELETADAAAGRVFLEDAFDRLGIAAAPESEPKSGRLFRALGLSGPC
jgi:uncharacterized protein YjbK